MLHKTVPNLRDALWLALAMAIVALASACGIQETRPHEASTGSSPEPAAPSPTYSPTFPTFDSFRASTAVAKSLILSRGGVFSQW